jgi:hypothetical protein
MRVTTITALVFCGIVIVFGLFCIGCTNSTPAVISTATPTPTGTLPPQGCYKTEYYDCQKSREYICYNTETYWVTEPYISYQDVDYIVTETGIYDWFWNTGSDVWVTIKNADTKSGYFYVTFYLITDGGATTTRYGNAYIVLGEETKINIKHSGDYIKSFTYSIDPPTKEVTQYHSVQKTRQVQDTCTEIYDTTCERQVWYSDCE